MLLLVSLIFTKNLFVIGTRRKKPRKHPKIIIKNPLQQGKSPFFELENVLHEWVVETIHRMVLLSVELAYS